MFRLAPAMILALLVIAAPMDVDAKELPATIALPNCIGNPQTRPSVVVFTCADAGTEAINLHWKHWGEQFATGIGQIVVNDCTPYCAAGHFHSSPTIVVVVGRQRCQNGRIAYQRVAYMPIVSGIANPGAVTQWWDRSCSSTPRNNRRS